jgi:hypothetical protein
MNGEQLLNNQNEMFTRLADVQKMQRHKNMENYGKELSQESDKRVREHQHNADQEKQYEFMVSMNKKKENDMLIGQTMQTKKSMQGLLAQDYENAVKFREVQKHDERRQNLMAGQVSNQKAQVELNYLRKAEDDKKRMIREILNNEKQSHDVNKKSLQSQSFVMGRAEAQKLMGDNEQKEQYRDFMDSQKYNNFNKFQSAINVNYQNQVAKPYMQKQAELSRVINKHEQDHKRIQELKHSQKVKYDENMRMSNRAHIEKQIHDKNSGKMVGATEYDVDFRKRVNHERNVNDVESFEKYQKKQTQNNYKDMLDSQVKNAKVRRMYGNMTGVEKSLNKDDLSAWKNYDHNTYAMIPGLNSLVKPISNKVIMEKQTRKKDRTHEEEISRMNQFGFTRDVNLARDPSYLSHGDTQPRRLAESHSVGADNRLGSAGGVSNAPSHSHSHVGYEPPSTTNQHVFTGEAPNRSLLKSGHRKYPNHHLFAHYNPINGAFHPVENGGNNNVLRHAGNNIFH